MRAIVCGANGAMGKLIREILGAEAIGLVSIDGENNVPKTFQELGALTGDVIIDFSHHSAVADVLSYAKANGFGHPMPKAIRLLFMKHRMKGRRPALFPARFWRTNSEAKQ